jgi:prepilin-type N-terminal cleavage/methylation domain-containing protein
MVRRGFTLLELLVTVIIIAALIAILIPAVKSARASANAATCMANLSQLGKGYMNFGSLRMGRLPGNHSQRDMQGAGQALERATPSTDADGYYIPKKPENAWMADWLAGMETRYDQWNDPTYPVRRICFFAEPSRGTIFEYVTSTKAYRCPTLAVEKWASGKGSNGQYDYTMAQCLNGARVDRVARTSYANNGANGGGDSNRVILPSSLSIATPVLVEEDPKNYLNTGVNLDGAWCWSDRTTYNHKGGTNIMTLDGSTYWFQPPTGFILEAQYIGMRSTATNYVRWGHTDNFGFGQFNGM